MFSVSCSVEEGEKASWSFILWESRLPQALTALLCGGALAVCGLMLQTAFKNPLAGPSILGINGRGKSGSGLRHAAVWRQHHGRGVQSVRLLLRTAWRIYRSHADYGTYPFLFHADKEQCHAADNGYHDRLHRFFGHCLLNFLLRQRGGSPI